MTETLVCNKCGVEKPIDAYYTVRNNPNSPMRRRLSCKACWKLYRNEYKMIGRRRAKEVVHAPRRASIDCKHVCPTCGMGADTEREALACCARFAEIAAG